MAENLDEQLSEYAARWRANQPELPTVEYPSGPAPASGRRRDLVWLVAAVVVAIAVGATVWGTRLLDSSDRDTTLPIGPTSTVPWATLDPTNPQFDAEAEGRYSTLAVTGDLDRDDRPGSTVTFEVTFTSEVDLVLDPCPDFTISQRFSDDDEVSESHALNCAAVPFKNAAGQPYLPAGRSVTFAMQTIAPEQDRPLLTWTLGNPGKTKVLRGRLIVSEPTSVAASGYCAIVRFKGEEYELSRHQFGEATGQRLGAAEGLHCGDSGTADLVAYTMTEEAGTEVIVVQYADGPLNYVRNGSSELKPVPYPEVILRSTGAVRDVDIGLARRFAQFAVTPTARLRDLVPFSTDGTSLRVGASSRLIQPGDLVDEQSWTLSADGFAGRDGGLNALQPLRDHLLGRLHPTQRSDGNLTLSEGDHERCAGPPLSGREGLGSLRHLAIQPAPGTYESCLDWFSVDLYLDQEGHVDTVLLDLWEP